MFVDHRDLEHLTIRSASTATADQSMQSRLHKRLESMRISLAADVEVRVAIARVHVAESS